MLQEQKSRNFSLELNFLKKLHFFLDLLGDKERYFIYVALRAYLLFASPMLSRTEITCFPQKSGTGQKMALVSKTSEVGFCQVGQIDLTLEIRTINWVTYFMYIPYQPVIAMLGRFKKVLQFPNFAIMYICQNCSGS